MLEIEVGFDGSCPHSPEGVERQGNTEFRILPSWRPEPGISEECIGCTTRLGFRVHNPSAAPVTGRFHIDWQYYETPPGTKRDSHTCESYMALRDFGVAQAPGRSDWRYVTAAVRESVATLRLDLPPGVTEIHWHPPYSYSQGEAFVAGLRDRPWTTVEPLSTSDEGRNLWLIRISDDNATAKETFFIRARTHAYESAGSYAMEGMVNYLLSEDGWAAAARRDYEFFILPMANPDGVHNGMGRLTAPRGTDMVWSSQTEPNRAHAAMMAAVERIRPAAFIDLHNWQSKRVDGLLGVDPARRDRFFYYMPAVSPHGKRWRVRDPERIDGPAPSRQTLGSHCRRAYGSRAASFELSWFGRTPDDARQFGAQGLRALLLADGDSADA